MRLISFSCLFFPLFLTTPLLSTDLHFQKDPVFPSQTTVAADLKLHDFTLLPSPGFKKKRHRSLEFGLSLGLVNYTGDVSEKVWVARETRPAFSVFFRYVTSPRWSIRAQWYTGNIGGADAYARRPELQARGLRFKSHLMELSMVGEWAFLKNEPMVWGNKIKPYLYGGIGGVLAHPEVEQFKTRGSTLLEFPLLESGLSETAVVLPFGGGIRIQIADNMACTLEGGWRPVWSDYLDGVSQNGNPGKKDWYYGMLASWCFQF